MRTPESSTWRAKLAAWLHDPAEKALILMRADHEEDSSIARLREMQFPEGVPSDLERIARLADHWASAADRPVLPKPGELSGEQRNKLDIRFWGRDGAVLKHPLDGAEYRIHDAYVETASTIEKASFAGLLPLLEDEPDPRRAFLRLWRLGPEAEPPGLGLGHLWKHLPADTRIPDHSIWEHLALTSAFAGAMAGDPNGNPALLAVSIGPVQSFISQARSTSDLWAGSHLLANLSWEAMKVVCERFGPDAVIFPNLWGVPMVDLWLEEQGVSFAREEVAPAWKRWASDSNPLFMAALPNRFVALAPASEAEDTAEAVKEAVRQWVTEKAEAALARLLETAGHQHEAPCEAREQLLRQLDGFPEVHWASVPFAPLVAWGETAAKKGTKTGLVNTEGLQKALGAFHPPADRDPGFLGTPQWKLLREAIGSRGIVYTPNPGVLYPALYDLLDRVMGAAKTVRPFGQTREEGYRCTLCGEREWLRGPGEGAGYSDPPSEPNETLWTTTAAHRPAWAGKGEHLCALCTLKRLWPDLFAAWVAGRVPELQKEKLQRFVVSTHTMALAKDLESLAERGESRKMLELGELRGLVADLAGSQRAALPRKIHRSLGGVPDVWPLVAQVPVALDAVRDSEREGEKKRLEHAVKETLGHKPEAYYAMMLFDGDRMGAWISGTDRELQLPFESSWHPKVVRALANLGKGDGRLDEYLKMPRPPSPARHAAISAALNGFALHVVPWVVEDLFAGKVLYAGGDDVLAMLPVDDVLPCVLTLRCAYSGTLPKGEHAVWELYGELKEQMTWIGKGHVLLGGKGNGRLLRMMGHLATASAGVIIAHHQTPLQAVLRELRGSEKRAKNEGGRNAFSISLMKRAGGTTRFTAGFGFGGRGVDDGGGGMTTLGVLFRLRDTLAREGVSRRAAYNMLAWLPDLPERPNEEGEPLAPEFYSEMLSRSIAWQLRRQGVTWTTGEGAPWNVELAEALVRVTDSEAARRGDGFSHTEYLASLLTVAEFLAREGRTIKKDIKKESKDDAGSVSPGSREGGAA